MILHSKYTDYKIIYKDEKVEKLQHITDSNRTIEIWYYESGKIQKEEWYLNGLYHREDGPAYINYYESGKIKEEQWGLNGERHREDGPAIISYYKSGKIQEELWSLNDSLHREDGPAWVNYYESGEPSYAQFFLNKRQYTYDEFIQTPEYQAYLKGQSINIFN